MDVVIIAHFCGDFDSSMNNRFNYMAELLAQDSYNVELITSDFSHTKKQKRPLVTEKLPYRVTFVSEPGYAKNVSLKRVYSHNIMARNLKKYLGERKTPDVIYCAVPSLDVADVAAQFARENHVRFIIDVQDLWPEAFKLAFSIPIVSEVLFFPMQKQADRVYATADEIIAVSQTYVNRAMSVNSKCSSGYSVFLGTELQEFDKIAPDSRAETKPQGQLWLAYIGTLGHSYDIKCVIDALKIAQTSCNIKFLLMGDGPLKAEFEKYAQEQGILVEFMGRLEYKKMAGLLKICDMAVNPIVHGAASIINKVGDYAAAGLPVLNTQECMEYRTMVEEYQMGLNCINNNAKDLADKIAIMCDDNTMRKEMGANSRRLAVEKFDRKRTYSIILELIADSKNGDNKK
jgi:glycosyltransferase involved in cell wall biosynthesis